MLQKTIKRTWFDGTNGRLIVSLYFRKNDHFEKIFLYAANNFSLIAVTLMIDSHDLHTYFAVSCEAGSAIQIAK